MPEPLVDALLDAEQDADGDDRYDDVGDVDARRVLQQFEDDERDLAGAGDGPQSDPEQVTQLAGGDMEAGTRHEPSDERLRHEGGDDPQPTHPHRELDYPGEQRHRAGHAHFGRVDVNAEGGGGGVSLIDIRSVEPHPDHLSVYDDANEKTDDGHRTDGDVARRAEDEVEDDGEEGAVEAVDGRDGGEQGEPHPLRDVDHTDAHSRDHVPHQPVAPVVRAHHADEGEEAEYGRLEAVGGARQFGGDHLADAASRLRLALVPARRTELVHRARGTTDVHRRHLGVRLRVSEKSLQLTTLSLALKEDNGAIRIWPKGRFLCVAGYLIEGRRGCILILQHEDNILNKFRIWKEWRIAMRKPYQLPGWIKNSWIKMPWSGFELPHSIP